MNTSVDFILKLLGTTLYFLPGIILSYLIFKNTTLIERTLSSIVFSVSIAISVSIVLARLGILNTYYIITGIIIANLVLITVFLIKRKHVEFKTEKIDTPFKLICFFAFLGNLWKYFFESKINLRGDGITSHVKHYFLNRIAEAESLKVSIPNLNFYTGMLKDRSNFLARYLSEIMFETLTFSTVLTALLAVFILCGFVYIVIKTFTKNENLALLGAAIMAIGPGELLHTTTRMYGTTYSYAALISLFILYKKEDIAYFWLALIMSVTITLTYYTAAMVNIIIAGSFAMVLVFKDIRFNRQIIPIFIRSLSQKKVAFYLLIMLLLASYIYLFPKKTIEEGSLYYYTARNVKAISKAPSDYLKTLTAKDKKEIVVRPSTKTTMPEASRPYKSRLRFLGMPVIAWQDLFFICLASTFVIHIFKKKISPDDKDILCAAIPAIILASTFLGVKMPERAFSYLSFFAILAAKIPKRAFKVFVISCLIFFIPTSYLVNIQRIKFLTNSKGEIQAAKWVSENLDKTILSDERFLSLVIRNGYYHVNGFPDHSPYMRPLFYNYDPELAKRTICDLNSGYFATTKRMRDDYILMLNFPSEPMENEQIYEEYFNKIYDNGDVRIYKISDCPN